MAVRGRMQAWEQTSTTPAKSVAKPVTLGLDFTKRNNTPNQERSAPGKLSQNKYTPTANQRPKSAVVTSNHHHHHNPGRFQGISKEEPAAPSVGGSSDDRMAHFRAAMEKEKAQKERVEAKKQKAEEMKKEEERKQEEEMAKKKEEEEKPAETVPAEGTENNENGGDAAKPCAPCQKKKRVKKQAKRTMSISNIVMDWVQEMTQDYEGVEIKNFSTSWSNGLAFCALIHKFNPEEFDFSELTPENRRHNFDLAFNTGNKVKQIPYLLDTNDLLRMKKPEPRSIQTYVQWIWSVYGPTSGYGPTPEEIANASIM